MASSSIIMGLSEIYSVPEFARVFEQVFSKREVAPGWKKEILSCSSVGDQLLDIGAGNGRLSEWILSHGRHVDSIEQHPHMFNLCKTALQKYRNARVYCESFPHYLGHPPYQLIVLHQNVLLELINEPVSRESVFKSLAEATCWRGFVLADYLENYSPPALGKWNRLFAGKVWPFDWVEYGYVITQFKSDETRAKLSLRDNRGTPIRSLEISFSVPTLGEIANHANSVGLKLVRRVKINQLTFFPAESVLCLFQKL
jgi:hypothetical protein